MKARFQNTFCDETKKFPVKYNNGNGKNNECYLCPMFGAKAGWCRFCWTPKYDGHAKV